MKKSIIRFISAIVIFAAISGSTVIAVSPVFTDTASHWARENIDYLTSNGAIKGYTDGTFKPENKITRAEFTAILLRALKNDVGQPVEGKWYDNYITEATNRKYIVAGEFDSVEKNITRGEMARMIVRTMTEEYQGNLFDYAGQLADYGKTPAEYKDFVLKAYVKGIITGRPGGVFAHADPATRAEATTMIVRLIDATKRGVPEEPGSKDLHIYELDAKQEMKVETSHPEFIPHIKKAIEIFSQTEFYEVIYSKKNNTVQFFMYKGKEDAEKELWERDLVLMYDIDIEKDPRSNIYLPYDVTLYDYHDVTGQVLYKALVKDIFPAAYDTAVAELEKTLEDNTYVNLIKTEYGNREARFITNRGTKGICFRTVLENQ